MSEIQSKKRPRSELNAEIELSVAPIEGPRRKKATNIEDEEPVENLWELLTSLEQELPKGDGESASEVEEEGTVESVMRRLAEASDDELGIPSAAEVDVEVEAAEEEGGGDLGMGVCSGLFWELEDEIANHYTLLHSELFL